MTTYPPEFLLSLPSIPVPASVTAVAGCSCGGLDLHEQGCTIWAVAPAEAMAALDDARRRLREHTDDLNRQLRAALDGFYGLPKFERHTHRCDEQCVCPVDGKAMWYAPSTGRHACQDPDCVNAHPGDGAQ